MYYIYQIENLNSGLIYIGCTHNYINRVKGHKLDLRSQRHNNPLLQIDYNNGDQFKYSVIQTVSSKSKALQIEKEFIWRCGHYNMKVSNMKVRLEAAKDICADISINDDWEFNCLRNSIESIQFSLIDYSIDFHRESLSVY